MGEVDTDERRIITLVDISERKALEESMRRMELFSVLGEMSANFAHEIKNAMLLLKLLTDMEELSREDMQTIRTSLTRMDRLVNLFLNFVRSSDTKVNKVNLRRFVEEILFFLKPRLEEKKIRLVTDIGEREVLISKDLVEIILVNLITKGEDVKGTSIRRARNWAQTFRVFRKKLSRKPFPTAGKECKGAQECRLQERA